MKQFGKKAALGLALGASVMTFTAMPAQAQYYHHRYYHHHNNGAGTAIVAGIAGLAIGAAIASSNDHRYNYDRGYYPADSYYRSNGYYRGGGYYPADGYYAQDDYRYCEVRRVWDPYLHRPVAVRYCR